VRVAVVTGGGRGIGRATVSRLAADGFAVAVWDQDASAAAEAAGLVEREGGSACAISCDISDMAAVERAASETKRALGLPWALVNNAGIDRPGLFLESQPEDWRRIIDVNLLGSLHVTKCLLGGMVTQGEGRVVCISSDAGRVGSTGEAVYAASKAGLLGFVKALAREVARKGICVNAVCPGPTEAGLLDVLRAAPRGEKIVEGMIRAVPLGRAARPEEIAAAIAFFLSPDSAYITGQTLSVSGGLTML
jgi:2-hydroxycyclohexanecarboxyl-CoA dehydrogenase